MSELERVSMTELRLRLAAYAASPPRKIDSVHVHHTWRPRHRDWRGLPTLRAMRQYHMTRAGMRDIAQHLTVAPDGGLWLGRDFAWPPASAKGHNGSSRTGPFMIEVVGDFDVAQDRLEGEQLRALVDSLAALADSFALDALDASNVEAWLHPHTRFAAKSCPGTGVYTDSGGWQALNHPVEGSATLPELVVRSIPKDSLDPVSIAARRSSRGAGERSNWSAAEDLGVPEHDEEIGVQIALDADRFSREARGMDSGPVTRGEEIVLAHHVVNSRLGELSSSGYVTTTEHLDRLFHTHLRGWLREHLPPRTGRTPKILLWAHGGLVGEDDALARVSGQAGFWKANGIYPVYFVWETGFIETLGQMLGGARGFTDWTDSLQERIARIGKSIWSAMRKSAWRNSQAVLDNGGVGAAVLVKRHLDDLFRRLASDGFTDVELHVVGHSAGSIFLCEMFAARLLTGVEGTQDSALRASSVQFLAPALRRDRFRDEMLEALGSSRFAMYTMSDERERDDNCGPTYRKSLLYLVRQALEVKRRTPLLGLERDVLDDARLRSAFGIAAVGAGTPVIASEHVSSTRHIFWSREPDGSAVTNATSHGGFDDDARTLDSVVRFIHRLPAGTPIDLPYESYLRQAGGKSASRPFAWPDFGLPPRPSNVAPVSGLQRPPPVTGARRLAVCVGIDRYPDKPLHGCVADARAWERYLTEQQGFSLLRRLHDDQATLGAIHAALAELVAQGRPGDILCFVYSGHGTQYEDRQSVDGDLDEPDGFDEGLVPVDAAQSGYLIDDLIAATIRNVADGCKLLMFMDCCHSGTNYRFAGQEDSNPDLRTRYLPSSQQALAATRAWVRESGLPRGDSRSVPAVLHFAACRDDEYAYESNGRGHFSLHMLAALGSGGWQLTPSQLMADVRNRFGASRRQTPRFHAGPWRDQGIFSLGASLDRGRAARFDAGKLPFSRD